MIQLLFVLTSIHGNTPTWGVICIFMMLGTFLALLIIATYAALFGGDTGERMSGYKVLCALLKVFPGRKHHRQRKKREILGKKPNGKHARNPRGDA